MKDRTLSILIVGSGGNAAADQSGSPEGCLHDALETLATMRMRQNTTTSTTGGLGGGSAGTVQWSHANGAGDALQMMRMFSFDLLVVCAATLDDMPFADFISAVRNAWPWQKWVLAGGITSDREEVDARSLGVLRIFDAMPDAADLIELIRKGGKVRASSGKRQSASSTLTVQLHANGGTSHANSKPQAV